jgi:hypothetical protein
MSAKTWKKPPSEIYRVAEQHGEYAAYCFDKAVMIFGSSYEADMHDAAMGAKTVADSKRAIKVVQARWLTDEEDEPEQVANPSSPAPDDKPTFRDPAMHFE